MQTLTMVVTYELRKTGDDWVINRGKRVLFSTTDQVKAVGELSRRAAAESATGLGYRVGITHYTESGRVSRAAFEKGRIVP